MKHFAHGFESISIYVDSGTEADVVVLTIICL